MQLQRTFTFHYIKESMNSNYQKLCGSILCCRYLLLPVNEPTFNTPRKSQIQTFLEQVILACVTEVFGESCWMFAESAYCTTFLSIGESSSWHSHTHILCFHHTAAERGPWHAAYGPQDGRHHHHPHVSGHNKQVDFFVWERCREVLPASINIILEAVDSV
jgi:hypothetical protein